jgi:hypothetical protein
MGALVVFTHVSWQKESVCARVDGVGTVPSSAQSLKRHRSVARRRERVFLAAPLSYESRAVVVACKRRVEVRKCVRVCECMWRWCVRRKEEGQCDNEMPPQV